MLYLDTTLELHGVTLYRDYSEPTRWYYSAGSRPEITRVGSDPSVQLIVYARDITDNPAFSAGDRDGGGFLTMGVDLSIPESTKEAIREELSSRVGGPVDLVPIPLESGSVRIASLGVTSGAAAADAEDTGPRFVENILASASPALTGAMNAAFSMELSREGAQLMEASLRAGGASQIVVIYEWTFKGLMPAEETTITIDFSQSYEYLRSRFQMNTLWFRTDIDAEYEELQKRGAITIEEVDYTGVPAAEAAQRQQRLETLAKELATWSFFQPALSPGRVLAVDRGQLTIHDPTTAAAAVRTGFSEPVRAAATGVGDPGGTAGPRLQGESATEEEGRAGGTPAPTGGATEDTIDSSGEGGDRELTAVERWNQMGRPQAAFSLKSIRQEEQQTITYSMRRVSAITRTGGAQGVVRLRSGEADAPGRILRIDLNDPFWSRIEGSVTTSADLAAAGVGSMAVNLRYGTREDGTAPKDIESFAITATDQKHEFAFLMDPAFAVDIEYQVTVQYRSGFAIGDPEIEATSPWIRTSTLELDIDPREIDALMDVGLAAGDVDWTAVSQIQATVTYEDDGAGLDRSRDVVLTQAQASAVVPIRPRDPALRGYSVDAQFFFVDGRRETVRLDDRGTKTLVLNQPTDQSIPISVRAKDPLARFEEISVELETQPASGSPQTHVMTLTGEAANQTWTIVPGDGVTAPSYRYRVTLFGQDGTTNVEDWQTSTARTLVVGDVFESILDVQVRLAVPDFAAAGLRFVKLRLEYPDAPDGIDADKEMVFDAPTEPVRWRMPRKAGADDQYQYTTTWMWADGRREEFGPHSVDDEVLILDPELERTR